MAQGNVDTLDESSKEMIFHGLNLSQLGRLFHMDHRTLVEKLHGVSPSGKRGKGNTYLVHEVAPYLVKPIFDIESYIKRMNHADLPKHLSKEFWAGQRAKQEYMLKEGDLWPTEEVVKKAGELLKLVSMSAKLARDTVARQVELTPRQRQIIDDHMDGMLRELRALIIKNFSDEALSDGEDEDAL